MTLLDALPGQSRKIASFPPDALAGFGDEILADGGPRAIRLQETRTGGRSIVVVARHEDVVQVLTDEDTFSVSHYVPLYQAVAPRNACLLMRPEGTERTERYAIFRAARDATPWWNPAKSEMDDLARKTVDDLIADFGRRRPRQFDIIGEYAYFVPYLIGQQVFGLPGPSSWGPWPRLYWWLQNFPRGRPFTSKTGPYLTQLAWAQPVFGQLFGFENRNLLLRIAAWIGLRALRAHIKAHIKAYLRAPKRGQHVGTPPTLLTALLSNDIRRQFAGICDDDYREHVISLMLELMGTAQTVPTMAFALLIQQWAKKKELHLPYNQVDGHLVDEVLRLTPPAKHLLRNATRSTHIGNFPIYRGEYVCALVDSAGRDWRAVSNPDAIEASRGLETYLHFGPWKGPHLCAGRPIAHAMLGQMLAGLKRMLGLRPTALMHSLGPDNPVWMPVTFDP